MDDQYTSIDTFSLGDWSTPPVEPGAASVPMRVIARLPRVADPSVSQRWDQPLNAIPGAHFPELLPTAEAMPADASAEGLDPTLTIRIDTLDPARVVERAPQQEAAHRLRRVDTVAPPLPTGGAQAEDEEYTDWLLQAEAMVLPYSRWIVLAAVIAAMGLTMVLLQGGSVSAPSEAEAPSPNAAIESETDALFADDSAPQNAEESLADWAMEPLPEEPPAEDKPALTASGPTAAPSAKLPQAQLSGYLESPGGAAVEVAARPSVAPYPSTSITPVVAPIEGDNTGSFTR